MPKPRASQTEALLALVEAPAFARRLYPRTHKGELSAHALQVLVAFSTNPDERVETVGITLELNTSTVSHALAALEKAGLIESRPTEDARRRSRHLTPAGKRAVATLVKRAQDLLAAGPGHAPG